MASLGTAWLWNTAYIVLPVSQLDRRLPCCSRPRPACLAMCHASSLSRAPQAVSEEEPAPPTHDSCYVALRKVLLLLPSLYKHTLILHPPEASYPAAPPRVQDCRRCGHRLALDRLTGQLNLLANHRTMRHGGLASDVRRACWEAKKKEALSACSDCSDRAGLETHVARDIV